MIHSGPPSETRMTWELSTVSGWDATKPVLAPVVVAHVVLNPPITHFLHSWGRGPIKCLNYEITHREDSAKGEIDGSWTNSRQWLRLNRHFSGPGEEAAVHKGREVNTLLYADSIIVVATTYK